MAVKSDTSPAVRHGAPSRGPNPALILLICFLALAIAAAAVFALISALRGDSEPEPTPSPTVEPTETPYIDFNGMQVEIVDGVEISSYAAEDFSSDENGWLEYTGGEYTRGIDISGYQEGVDWQAVRDSGMDFVMLRAAFRGYGAAGTLVLDDLFFDYAEGALEAGLEVGVYMFSQAVNVREAEEEADFLLAAIDGYPITYPVIFDWERISEEGSRTAGLGGADMTACALAFCRRIADAGYTPGVYINMTDGYLLYDLTVISRYDIWLAEYDDHPDFYYNFAIWQYTSEGAVPGVEGIVDLDLCFRKYGE